MRSVPAPCGLSDDNDCDIHDHHHDDNDDVDDNLKVAVEPKWAREGGSRRQSYQ